MKINVVMPTLYGYRTNSYLPQVVSALIIQLEKSGYEYTLTTLGRDNPEYNKFTNDKIIKKYVGGLEGINTTRGMNAELAAMADEDYFCFIHDDINVQDDNWLNIFIHTTRLKDIKTGFIGLVPHTNSFIKKINTILEHHVWTDGVMFCDMNIIREIGRFDEQFNGDCEGQDYQYRAMQKGYVNIKVNVPFEHKSVPFRDKVDGRCGMELSEKAILLFSRKWHGKQLGKYILSVPEVFDNLARRG